MTSRFEISFGARLGLSTGIVEKLVQNSFFCTPRLQSNLQKQRIAHEMTAVASFSK
jgi:hypothetical protein